MCAVRVSSTRLDNATTPCTPTDRMVAKVRRRERKRPLATKKNPTQTKLIVGIPATVNTCHWLTCFASSTSHATRATATVTYPGLQLEWMEYHICGAPNGERDGRRGKPPRQRGLNSRKQSPTNPGDIRALVYSFTHLYQSSSFFISAVVAPEPFFSLPPYKTATIMPETAAAAETKPAKVEENPQQQEEPKLPIVEVDSNTEPEDDDEGFSSSNESSTTSMASSIYNYKHENGRRYHAYREGKYAMPNDEIEQGRLDVIPPHLVLPRIPFPAFFVASASLRSRSRI